MEAQSDPSNLSLDRYSTQVPLDILPRGETSNIAPIAPSDVDAHFIPELGLNGNVEKLSPQALPQAPLNSLQLRTNVLEQSSWLQPTQQNGMLSIED